MLRACRPRQTCCSTDTRVRCTQVVTGANLSGELSITFWPWLGTQPLQHLK